MMSNNTGDGKMGKSSEMLPGGSVPSPTVEPGAAVATVGPVPARVRDGESRAQAWERIRKEGRAAGLSRRAAYERANVEAERLFPPPEPAAVEDQEPAEDPEPAEPAPDPPPIADDGGDDHLRGLGDIPDSWPDLPANATLAAEVQWVQSNRLRVVDGRQVDLSRALAPAPSHAALAWLETAVLFPSKWADVTIKTTSHAEDDREATRRERLAIAEVEELLREMTADPSM